MTFVSRVLSFFSPSHSSRSAASMLPQSKYAPWNVEKSDYREYEGMNIYYREYRRDALVRSCLDAIAWTATSKGFETRLEAVDEMTEDELEKYAFVKDKVDAVNKAVNMDWILSVGITKKRIYGNAGFEVVRDQHKEIVQLISLASTDVSPKLSPEWELLGYRYRTADIKYTPDEVLYFTHNSLEADYEGMSDIEPILTTISTRRALLEAIEKTSRLMWAPIAVHTVDVSGLDATAAMKALEDHKRAIKPGKHLIKSQKITVDMIDLKPSKDLLSGLLQDMNDEIIGHFSVPKILFARTENVNRATAEIMMEGFFDSVIAKEQRYLKREIETQFYDMIVREELGLADDAPLPVHVKHSWNQITVEDFHQMASTVALLFEKAVIDEKKAWELLGWEVEEEQNDEENEEEEDEEEEEEEDDD